MAADVAWGTGLAPALLAVGSAYAVATLSPQLRPALRGLDRLSPAAAASGQAGEPDPDLAGGRLR